MAGETTIESALYTLLTSDSSVAALVGTRIYPLLVPDGTTLPAVAYQQISLVPRKTHSGPNALLHERYQLTVHASGYDSARTVRRALRDCLDGYVGDVGMVHIQEIQVQNEYDGFDLDSDFATVRIDLIVHFEE